MPIEPSIFKLPSWEIAGLLILVVLVSGMTSIFGAIITRKINGDSDDKASMDTSGLAKEDDCLSKHQEQMAQYIRRTRAEIKTVKDPVDILVQKMSALMDGDEALIPQMRKDIANLVRAEELKQLYGKEKGL